MNDFSRLRLQSENLSYRLGDLVLKKPGTRKRDVVDIRNILESPCYKDTILYDYLVARNYMFLYEKPIRLPDDWSGPDFSLLRAITFEHINRKNYEVSNDDELVVHLRLGDRIGPYRPPNAEAYREGYRKAVRIYYSFLERINLEGISTISIVTALNFSPDYEHEAAKEGAFLYTEKKHNESLHVLEVAVKCCKRHGYSPNIISGSADEDFAYLASSNNLVVGGGGFAACAAGCLLSNSVSAKIHDPFQ